MIKAYDKEMDAKNRRAQENMDTLASEILDGLEKLKDDLKPNDK